MDSKEREEEDTGRLISLVVMPFVLVNFQVTGDDVSGVVNLNISSGLPTLDVLTG